MRTDLRFVAAAIALLAGSAATLAAASVSGTVSNAATRNLLEGASVDVPALGLTALTDPTGRDITAFTATTPGRNLYRFQYATVNAGLAWQARPGLQFTLDAANLTNEPQAFYRGIPAQMQNTILNGTTLTFGVNGRF